MNKFCKYYKNVKILLSNNNNKAIKIDKINKNKEFN